MVCKLMSTKRVSRRAPAFTLVETLVAMGVGSMLLVVIFSLSFYSSRSFAAMANYADLDSASRNALDRMTRDIRGVNRLTSFSTNQVSFEDIDLSTLSYVYNPLQRTLVRTQKGVSQVLLTECDRLTFSIFQRNPIGGTYDQYPAANNNPDLCKLVQVNWTCSRKIFGQKVNTESVQTAKIVIRRQ